ncbi:MAG: hypothetical protein OEU54_03460 [Gemmatimonadota bacterium]|nr:hypothetical protein [Gemmatimonadota bacterium]
MIDVDRKLGPWRGRVWGLVLNFVGNVIALVGLVRLMRGGSAWVLAFGLAVTLVCVAVLAVPSRGHD